MKRLAIAVVTTSVALAIAATALAVLNLGTPKPAFVSLGSVVIEVVYPIALLIPVACGALAATRQPRHPVPWCFLLFGLGGEVLTFAQNYGVYGTETAPGLPAAAFALWYSQWAWVLPTPALSLAILLFPDGHLPSPRWQPVVWAIIAGTLIQGIGDALRAPLNPAIPGLAESPSDGLLWIGYLGVVLWSGGLLVAGVSLVVRFRRARGAERQQLKWVAYAATVAVTTLVLSSLSYGLPVVAPITTALSAISVLLIPAAAAVAILRYRLYDIDVVIERTIVYAAVSVTLGATYGLAVVVLQGIFRPITGGSDIAVALSTLLVIALFQPIRRRAQDAVDRRFYRARYDAARTVDAFAVRLRGEVDLEAVRDDLIAVVHDAIHPTHASVWLRERAG